MANSKTKSTKIYFDAEGRITKEGKKKLKSLLKDLDNFFVNNNAKRWTRGLKELKEQFL